MSEFDTKCIKEGKRAKEDKGKRNRRGKSKGQSGRERKLGSYWR